ncbi:MAG: hypothetical protein ACLRWQ_19505 [Flavonifractor plautii]
MRVLNRIDRFNLVIDTVKRLPQLGNRGAFLIQLMKDKLWSTRSISPPTARTCPKSGTGSGTVETVSDAQGARLLSGPLPFSIILGMIDGKGVRRMEFRLDSHTHAAPLAVRHAILHPAGRWRGRRPTGGWSSSASPTTPPAWS